MCATASALGNEKKAKALRPAGARGPTPHDGGPALDIDEETAADKHLGEEETTAGPDCQEVPCVSGTCGAGMVAVGPDCQGLLCACGTCGPWTLGQCLSQYLSCDLLLIVSVVCCLLQYLLFFWCSDYLYILCDPFFLSSRIVYK